MGPCVLLVLLALGGWLLTPPAVLAAGVAYYVSPSGSDGVPCGTAANNPSAPRQTLKEGTRCLNSGDILHVRAGTYTNQCLGDYSSADVWPIPAGTASFPTIIRNAPGETVTIQSTHQCDGSNAPILLVGSSPRYIVLDGINITGNGTFSLVELSGPAPQVTMRNMVIAHSGTKGLGGAPKDSTFENITIRYSGRNSSLADVCPDPENGCHGVYIHGHDVDAVVHTSGNLFSNITSHDHIGIGFTFSCEGCGHLVHDNILDRATIYNNKSYGMYGYPNNIVRNSVMYNNYTGISGNINAYNNTVIQNTNTNVGGDPANLGIFIGGTSGQTIRNNIVLGHPDGDIVATGGGATYSNNICGALDSPHGCTITSTQAALFKDPGARDFHLLPTASAAINAALTVSEVTTDWDNQARVSGQYDIGADEFVAGNGGPTPATLVFVQQPSNTQWDQAIAPPVTVQVLDSTGAVYTTPVTVTMEFGTNPHGGTLSGTLTASSSGGLATFSNLHINIVGAGYTLQATSPGLTPATSTAFTMLLEPSGLAFVNQPVNVPPGTVIPPVTVHLRDFTGGMVAANGIPVTVALQSNPTGATLGGTLTVATVAGIATFNTLQIATAGTGYTLRATSPGLTAGDSTPFNITAAVPPPTDLAVNTVSTGMFITR